MTSLIAVNDGTEDVTSPVLVLGWETKRQSQNIIHDLIGGGIGVTLIRPRPRSGTLELLYTSEDDAAEALEFHGRETTFSLSDTDRSSVAMTYVVNGECGLALDRDTRDVWVVAVGYQEVEQ